MRGSMNVVIIGSSAAGLSCLETLLRFSPDITITVISEEPYSPYCRCLLTYYLGNVLNEKQMGISEITSYPANTRFLLGKRVTSIDTARKSVLLSGGEKIEYEKLLIATGSDAVKPAYYDEGKKTFTLRYMDDAKKIQPHLKSKAIILGGGFVGIKSVIGMLERKIDTTLVITSRYPASMIADEKTGSVIGEDLKQMGVDIRTGEDIVGIKMQNSSIRVSLSSGSELDSDVVIVGKGVKPRIDLAKDSGIKTDRGITVNEFLETSTKGVYAAGDCCETMDVVRNTRWINAIWPVAVEQGYHAALNMLGKQSPYPGSLAMNSLKTPLFHLIVAGILKGGDGITLFEHYTPSTNQFRKLAVRVNIPVGMAFYNNPEDAGVIVNLIKKGIPLTVDPAKIVRNEVSMMDILKPL
jgi:NAD(P)H-nitrite reductase large subunit